MWVNVNFMFSLCIIVFQLEVVNRDYDVLYKDNINWCYLVGFLIYHIVYILVADIDCFHIEDIQK